MCNMLIEIPDSVSMFWLLTQYGNLHGELYKSGAKEELWIPLLTLSVGLDMVFFSFL